MKHDWRKEVQDKRNYMEHTHSDKSCKTIRNLVHHPVESKKHLIIEWGKK